MRFTVKAEVLVEIETESKISVDAICKHVENCLRHPYEDQTLDDAPGVTVLHYHVNASASAKTTSSGK